MTRCPPLCKRNMKLKEEKKAKRVKKVATIEEKKIVRWAVDNKKDWKREEEVKADYKKIKKMVPQRFLR